MNGFAQSAGVDPQTVSLYIRMLIGASFFILWGSYQVYGHYHLLSKKNTDIEDMLGILGRVFIVLSIVMLIIY